MRRALTTAIVLAALLPALCSLVRLEAAAQDDPLTGLNAEYAQLEREGLKENYIRLLSYTMLQEYLPPGTRFTSGYRSPQKQLDLIARMARSKGIPAPDKMSLEDENSWRPTLIALRAQGFIIAAPTSSPHSTDEAVFDLAGADLGAIQDGLRTAEKAGMVKFRRIIFERQNNAVHVEIESLSPKALNALGRRRGADGPSSSPPGAGTSEPPASPEVEQRLSMLQQLQNLHDSEPDPAKKIDYDRSKRNLLDPSTDADKIQALDEEIRQHQREAAQLGSQTQKKEAFERVSAALREDRLEDAEREAEALIEKFPNQPEAKTMLARVRTRRLVGSVSDVLYGAQEPGCDECREADEMLTEALSLSPGYEGTQFLREDIDACHSRCRRKRVPFLILGAFAFAGLVVAGGYFVIRAGGLRLPSQAPKWLPLRAAKGWVLEGIEGACKGQVFPLNKGELIIGSEGPPAGAADIVIRDAERKISRSHCLLMNNGKQFYITDESTNGTKVNDREIPKGAPSEIRQGDRITLANVAALTLRPR